MTDLASVVGATLVTLAIVAGVVIGGHDATYFVPPPESVAESFTRHVASRRYDRAVRFIDRSSGISESEVRQRGERLHAEAGGIDQVEGEPGAINGASATASALIVTERAGRVRFRFRLVRTRYIWLIAEWTER
jgi:hypothetical protein